MTWGKVRVKQLRTSLGLSQSDFARALGCRQQTVSEWELGMYEPANAYGRLLEMLETQYRQSAPQLAATVAPVHQPKAAKPLAPENDFQNFENQFDKAFDPGID